MKATILIIAAGLAAFASPARAAILYKSVDANGVIQFSDQPPERGTQSTLVAQMRIPDTESRTPGAAVVPGPSSEEQLRGADEALQRANAQVDLAEHALAEARRTAQPPGDPMRLASARPSRPDMERVEFYKKGVLLARQNLMEVLKEKRKADARATYTASNVVSSEWVPVEQAAALTQAFRR
jgi:hypothetical protein